MGDLDLLWTKQRSRGVESKRARFGQFSCVSTAMATPNSIAQLRSKLEDVEDFDELIQDDLYLALWLNLTHLDLKKAEACIRDASQWWKAKDVRSITQETFPLSLANKMPIFLDGISKDGLPVGYVRFTAVDIHGLLEDWTPGDITRRIIQLAYDGLSITLERNRERYEKLGDESLKTARGHVAIVDLHGYSPVNMFIQIAREGLKIPSSARNAYIIGVSKFIVALMKPVIPLLNALGVNLKVYGTDEKTWGPDVYKIIDKSKLDEFRERSIKFENAIERYNKC